MARGWSGPGLLEALPGIPIRRAFGKLGRRVHHDPQVARLFRRGLAGTALALQLGDPIWPGASRYQRPVFCIHTSERHCRARKTILADLGALFSWLRISMRFQRQQCIVLSQDNRTVPRNRTRACHSLITSWVIYAATGQVWDSA